MDKRAIDLDGAWAPQEERAPLVEEVSWIEEPPALESLAVPMDAKWRQTPVRGPPSVRV